MKTLCLADQSRKPLALAALAAALCLAASSVAAAQSEHWRQWRGPNFNGAAEATGLPAEFGPEKNVVWAVDLPGSGSATPILCSGRIFLNSVDSETNQVLALGLDAADGSELWRHDHGENRRMGRNDRTAPSAVADGERVIFFFATGRLVAYNYDGEELWRRELEQDLGALTWLFGYGASPTLQEGRLYLQMMRRDQTPWRGQPPLDEPVPSYLLAFNPETGEDLWKVERPTDAQGESHESYITPLPLGAGEGSQIVLAGADAVTGHDAATGEELWRYTYNEERRRRNWRLVPTPATDGERIFMPLPRRDSTMPAFRPDQENGPLAERADWTMPRFTPDVCSPLLYGGRLYILCGDRRVLTSLNPETGEQYWQGELGDGAVVRSSPTAADGKIYVMDERGRIFVAGTGDEFELLATIEMGGGEPARSSIPIVGNRLYVRTASRLFCIAQQP